MYGLANLKKAICKLKERGNQMFSKENLEQYKELQESFMGELEKVLNEKVQIEENIKRYRGDIRSIEFYNDKIEVETYEEAHCSCCSGEYYNYTIPESYLYEDAWVGKLKKQIEEKKEKARLKEEEEKKRFQALAEEREREQYEKLKQKFEHK